MEFPYSEGEATVYHLKVGTDKVTTLVFPQPITALEGSGITADPKTPAKIFLSYHAGDRFLSVRSLAIAGMREWMKQMRPQPAKAA